MLSIPVRLLKSRLGGEYARLLPFAPEPLTAHFIFFVGPATRSVTMMSSSKTKREPLNGRLWEAMWFSFPLVSNLA